MKKQVVSFLLITTLSFVFPSLFEGRPDSFLISTLYTVSGIMFSIGLGLIVTFNMAGIKNKNHILAVRRNLESVRNSFLKYFSLATTCLIFSHHFQGVDYQFEMKGLVIKFSPSILFFILIGYAILFFILNFLEVQKLSHDIFDKVNQEENK